LKLAAKLGHRVEVIAFTSAPLKRLAVSAAERNEAKKRLLSERQTQVQAQIDKHSVGDQKVSLKVVWEGDIVPWVERHCSKHSFDFVVKTTQLKDSLINTPTDWQLLRECPAPVLMVAEHRWHRTKPVLVALDLGTKTRDKKQLNHRLIEHGKQLAAALDTEIKLITAVEIPTLLADLDLVDPGAYVKEQKEAMQPHIRELAKAHELPESAFRCKKGPTAQVITSTAARDRAQIVVMGTVGRQGVKARILGNTAENVLRHLKTDVLALKP
jgi:universal stress protein E